MSNLQFALPAVIVRAAATLGLLAWAVLAAQAQQPPAAPAPEPAAAPSPVGEWLVAKKVARIKIVNCDNRLWGVVSWEAKPGVDNENANEELRGRPTLGMPVLLGMRQTGANKWEGHIYNSENGHTYAATISLRDPNTLRVQGCFLDVLCGGQNWTRVEEPEPQHNPSRTTGRGSEPAREPDPICASLPGAAGPAH